MAENVLIRIREDGSLKVIRNLNILGDKAKVAGRGVGVLQRSLGLLGGVLAVNSIIQYSDAYTQLQNRIRLVAKDTRIAAAVTEELRQTANDTRTSFQGTAEFYARAALASRELGISQKQLIELTRSVNQAIILSGATGVEAEKGLIQFSQGIASGSLRGDELRSVLEQLPLVADVIAERLGVTRGALRKLGAQGKITSEVIFEAFKNSREELEKAFKDTVPTIQQSFTVLRNEVVVFIGRFNQGTGASKLFSKAILELAKHVDDFVRIIAAGALAAGIQQITRGVKGLTLAIATNPVGLLITGLTFGIGALVTFSDQIGFSHKGLTTLQDAAVGFFQAVQSALVPMIENMRRGFLLIDEMLGNTFGGLKLDLRTSLVAVGKFVDGFVGIFSGLALGTRQIVIAVSESFALLLRGDLGGAKRAIVGIGGQVKDAFLTGLEVTTFTELAENTFDNAATATAKRLAAKNRELRLGPVDLTVAPEPTAPPLSDADVKKKLTLDDVIRQLQNEGRLLQLNNREREREEKSWEIIAKLREADAKFDESDVAKIDHLIAYNQDLADEARLLEEIRGPQIEFRTNLAALNSLLSQGKITQDEYTKKLAELNRVILETDNSIKGAGKGLLAGFIQPAQSLFKTLEQTGIGTMQAFGDALSETFEGRGNIGDFFENLRGGLSDVLGQLAQLTLRLLIIQAITAAGGGGFLASIGITGARAFGGTTQGGREGRMMRVGESGPENVFVGPGQQATVQPAQQPASQQNTFIAVADPRDVPRFINSTDGKNVMVQVVSRYRTEFRNALGV